MTREERKHVTAALRYLSDLPSGLDPDPDPDNRSPEDLAYHLGGLVARELRLALGGER